VADLLKSLGCSKALIGMVHVGALPGTPRHEHTIDELVAQSVRDAKVLMDAGFDAIIIENMHDAPYVHGDHGPEIAATMTRVAVEVSKQVSLPMGIQVLSGGENEALAIAHASSGCFIRCENFVYAHVADEGLLQRAAAGPLLRYRRTIGAEKIAVCCDLKKKHASHAITADVSIEEAAHAAEFFGADAMIVSGGFTGQAVDLGELKQVKAATSKPVLVGSGVTAQSAAGLLEIADALIVGSSIKVDGHWTQPVDEDNAKALVRAAQAG